MEPDVRKALDAMTDAAASAVAKGEPWQGAVSDEALRGMYGTTFGPIITEAARMTYEAAVDRVTKNVDDAILTAWEQFVAGYVQRTGAAKITRMLQATREMIAAFIESTVPTGISQREVGAFIRRKFKDGDEEYRASGGKRGTPPINASRARRIAATEVGSAMNAGHMEGARAAAGELDIEMNKSWLATPDGRTRESHAMANGQTVGLDEDFDVGGEKMRHPMAEGASAANVINCRCTVTFDIPDR